MNHHQLNLIRRLHTSQRYNNKTVKQNCYLDSQLPDDIMQAINERAPMACQNDMDRGVPHAWALIVYREMLKKQTESS